MCNMNWPVPSDPHREQTTADHEEFVLVKPARAPTHNGPWNIPAEQPSPTQSTPAHAHKYLPLSTAFTACARSALTCSSRSPYWGPTCRPQPCRSTEPSRQRSLRPVVTTLWHNGRVATTCKPASSVSGAMRGGSLMPGARSCTACAIPASSHPTTSPHRNRLHGEEPRCKIWYPGCHHPFPILFPSHMCALLLYIGVVDWVGWNGVRAALRFTAGG